MDPSDGYVATLDVLGFSDMLYRDGYAQKLKDYIDAVNKVVRNETSTECVMFSDSIVLTSAVEDEDEDDTAFESILRSCAAASFGLLKSGIPVRGAIAFGRYWRESNNGSVFLAGRPIVEAYSLERSLKWVGTLLATSVLHRRPLLKTETSIPDEGDFRIIEMEKIGPYWPYSLRLQLAEAPYHDSNGPGKISGYGIVPLDSNVETFQLAQSRIGQVVNRLEDLRMKAALPSAQAKYDSTVNWLKEVRERFKTAVVAQKAAQKPLPDE